MACVLSRKPCVARTLSTSDHGCGSSGSRIRGLFCSRVTYNVLVRLLCAGVLSHIRLAFLLGVRFFAYIECKYTHDHCIWFSWILSVYCVRSVYVCDSSHRILTVFMASIMFIPFTRLSYIQPFTPARVEAHEGWEVALSTPMYWVLLPLLRGCSSMAPSTAQTRELAQISYKQISRPSVREMSGSLAHWFVNRDYYECATYTLLKLALW